MDYTHRHVKLLRRVVVPWKEETFMSRRKEFLRQHNIRKKDTNARCPS